MDRLLRGQGLWVTRQENALTLTASFRLDYKSLISFVTNLVEKFLKVGRQIESWREKIVVIRKDGLEAHEVSTKHVFLC